ncbi:MAG TPA: tetratricopeptide repeat protein [Candidatus Binataceae bacterium]|nr:tetratricopeptide repeat protein [Candidatus Binataceae bacterium]
MMEGSGAVRGKTFSTRTAARIVAVSPHRIRYWVKHRLVHPVTQRGRRYRFAFRDLLLMRLTKELLPTRHHLEPVQRCLARLHALLDSSRPLTALKLVNDDGRIVVREGALRFDAESGQLLLDFAPATPGKVEEGFGPARLQERFEEAKRLADEDPLKALQLYADVLGHEPRNFEAHTQVAALLEERGDLGGALRHLHGAATILPTSAVVHLKLGLVYRKREELEAAARSLLRAIECDPTSIDAHRNLAEIYERLGRPREALRHMSAAHRLSRGE